MRCDARPTAGWQRDVPEAIRSFSTLTNPDYADLFTATTSRSMHKHPEQIARAAMEGVPVPVRLIIPLVQRLFLGLRLQWRPSPDYVIGWRIADRGENWFRAEAASWFMTTQLVVVNDEGQVSVGAFVRYDRRIAALVWPPVSLLHRQVGLAVMRQTARAL